MKTKITTKELFINELIHCECGKCGLTLWKYRTEKGKLRLDRPRKFIKGHGMKGKQFDEEFREKNRLGHIGKKLSEETKKKLSQINSGEGNPMYGKEQSIETKNKIGKANSKDIVGYSRLHYKVRRLLPRPDFCELCLVKPSYEVACLTHIYNMDFKNWKWVCRSCHKKHDYKLRRN